jgi:hypothetical protein
MIRYGLALCAVCQLMAPPLGAQTWPDRGRVQPEACVPMSGDAAAWLRRADSATGLSALGNRLLAFRATDSYQAMEQSDRVYPPFISSHTDQVWWFDPASGAERWGPPPVGPAAPRTRDYLRDGNATVAMRDTAMSAANAQLEAFFLPTRALNPLAVLRDMERRGDAVVVQRCVFRDYPRVVLQSRASGERLYLDVKSGVPVKFEREEPHYVWGQVHAEYLYTTWTEAGPVILPYASIRLIDGVEESRRSLGSGLRGASLARDSAPAMPAIPSRSAAPATAESLPAYFAESPVDTVRVGPTTFLLHQPGYTHAVTLAHDTLVLFDASTGEWRSRADSAWIARLFPGVHPMVLVVTDLAWPHVSGVRFWVARGATIVTHAISKPFLQQVIDRRWTRTPDALEQVRARVHPAIRTTTTPLSLAGGAIRLTPIDGVASEGALIAEITADQFLWASDYIQHVGTSSQYLREVVAAAHRAGFTPRQVAAEHLPLTPWSIIASLATQP